MAGLVSGEQNLDRAVISVVATVPRAEGQRLAFGNPVPTRTAPATQASATGKNSAVRSLARAGAPNQRPNDTSR